MAKALFVTCEEACYKITGGKWVEVIELQSTQGETDTCLLLHALHEAKSESNVVIISAEAKDIMVLCIGFHIPCPVHQKCGTQNHTHL